jgi:DNA-binding Lrp family transcriptional regulator
MELPLSDLEIRILGVLQKGFPITRTPYQDMAREIGIETAELLEILKRWREEGKLRRIGAVVSHVKVGLAAGAMVVWQVEPDRIEKAGRVLAGFPQVSHAYERPSSETWPYNLYTMVHGADDKEVDETVRAMSRACGIDTYCKLQTLRELKKVPPTYIKDRGT